jgi:hypothetical protein
MHCSFAASSHADIPDEAINLVPPLLFSQTLWYEAVPHSRVKATCLSQLQGFALLSSSNWHPARAPSFCSAVNMEQVPVYVSEWIDFYGLFKAQPELPLILKHHGGSFPISTFGVKGSNGISVCLIRNGLVLVSNIDPIRNTKFRICIVYSRIPKCFAY